MLMAQMVVQRLLLRVQSRESAEMTHAHAEAVRSIRSAAAKTNKRCVTAQDKTRNRSASLARHSKLTYIDAVEETTD